MDDKTPSRYREPRGAIEQGLILGNVKILSYTDRPVLMNVVRAVVITQQCDLEDHYRKVDKNEPTTLPNVLLLPLFSGKDWFRHLSFKPKDENATKAEIAKQNNDPRYQYLASYAEAEGPYLGDFKRVITIPANFLVHQVNLKECQPIATLEPLYAESVTQRFSYFLSRIPLPFPHHEELNH